MQRAPGELAVADLAAAGSAEAADLAHRIRREVIVQHEIRVGEALQPVDHLLGFLGAERGRHDRLRLAAGEQSRAMRARQEVDHRFDRTHGLRVAPVDAAAFLEDRGADDLALELLAELGGLEAGGGVGIGEVGVHRLLGGRDRGDAIRLAGQLVGLGQAVADQRADLRLEVGIVADRQLPHVLGGLLGELDDRVDDLLRCVVREHDRPEHDLFRELLGLGFDHHHRIVGGGDDEVELALLDLVERGVEDVFAVDIADPRRADRAEEGHAREGQRRRRRDHRDDVGLVLAVIAQHLGDDVDLVVEAFREERADRPVDQAAGERLLLGGAALALEEAARNAAGGGELLLIVDGEREEVLPVLDRAGGGHRAQHDRLAERREHRAVGLAGDAPRLEGQRLAAPLDFRFLHIEHLISLSPAAGCRAGPHVRAVRLAAVRDIESLWTSAGLPRSDGLSCRDDQRGDLSAAPFGHLRRPSFAMIAAYRPASFLRR